MRVTFFIADRTSGSSRLRVLPFAYKLREEGHRTHLCWTVPSRNWRPPASFPSPVRWVFLAVACFMLAMQRVLQMLWFVQCSDVVMVQKSLAYRLPLLRLERLLTVLSYRCRVRLVYDLDDAVLWGCSRRALRRSGKEALRLAGAADVVLAGSRRLLQDCHEAGVRAVYLPTCVPCPPCGRQAADRLGDTLRICWTGAASNLCYLAPVLRWLEPLAGVLDLQLTVVTALGRVQRLASDCIRLRYVEWSVHEEAAVLAASDVGLAPLPAGPWEQRKCSARFLRLMSAGLPVVASPVGAQEELVRNGVNGLCAGGAAEWRDAILSLASDAALRARLGSAARQTAEEFQVETWYPMWRSQLLGLCVPTESVGVCRAS